MARHGSLWVGWLWLAMGGLGLLWVVLARCGSIGFDGLAGLDSMVVVCGSVVSLGMNLMGSHGSPWVR